MCINMQPDQHYYTQYNFQLPFLKLGTPIPPFYWKHCINFCPSPTSPPHGAYTREFRGHYHLYSPQTTKPNWEYPNWYSVPTSSNFYCGKSWVRSIHQDGRPYPNTPRVDDIAHSKLRHSIINISEWLQAFTVYISVIAKKQHHHVPDAMGYRILILKARNEYCNDCWLGNDWLFQQQAASHISPTVSDQIWTPPYGTWLSMVKQELANAVTASVCFTLPKIMR